MIKRVLVALDTHEDMAVATHYGADLGKRFDAEVSGLAVLDTQRVAVAVRADGAINGLSYTTQTRTPTTRTTQETARALTRAFQTTLKRRHVRHSKHIKDAVPYQQIIEDMKYHDLLVMSKMTHFDDQRPQWKVDTLAQMVKRVGAPTLVVGKAYRPIQRVLLAYDGSDAAVRTLQRFAQFQPFGTALELELVHVCTRGSDRARGESEQILRLMRTFLQAHGFMLVTETILDGGPPKARLLEHVQQFDADLVVAGAHSVSAMRRAAFGSTTYTLLKACTVPLFLFH